MTHKAKRSVLILLAIAGLVACADPQPSGSAERPASLGELGGVNFLVGRAIYEPLFAWDGSGVLYIVWREAGEGGSNLFISRRDKDRVFGPAVRINDLPDSASSTDFDEMRVGVGVSGDHVGIAWTTKGSDIRAAISHDGAKSFERSAILNSDQGSGAYRGFVDTDVDTRGVLHAAWIDGRYAPEGLEEPAELMYARVENGIAQEQNLTTDQPDSICGCCRVDLDVRRESVVIAFRNTGEGYRDIFRVEGNLDGDFGVPARLGPPMWELRGCPTFGPANVGDTTVWGEASTGKRRLLAASNTEDGFQVLFEDTDEWAIARPPRVVIGTTAAMILVPGRPTGKILASDGESWRVSAEDLPPWAMSALLEGDELTLLGAISGDVRVQTSSIEL